MKLATLLLPAYLPRAYPGATPTPYQSGTVDKFERELVALSPLIVRHSNSVRLSRDIAGRFAHSEIVTAYDFMWDQETDSLGLAIVLALKSFGLPAITVAFQGEAEEFSLESVEHLMGGLHPWNEEE